MGRNNYDNVTAEPNDDDSITIHLGGCDDCRVNCIPVTLGWSYVVRLNQPGEPALDGSRSFPAFEGANCVEADDNDEIATPLRGRRRSSGPAPRWCRPMPATYVDPFRVRIDPEKSGETEAFMRFDFADGTSAGLHIRRAVAEFVAAPDDHDREPDITLTEHSSPSSRMAYM